MSRDGRGAGLDFLSAMSGFFSIADLMSSGNNGSIASPVSLFP